MHSANCFVPPSSSLCGIVGGDLTRITVHAFRIIQWKHLQFVFTFILQKTATEMQLLDHVVIPR